MNIGLAKEIKNHEYRVALTPSSVKSLIDGGNKVLVTHNAGLNAGFGDHAYEQVGAKIVPDNKTLFSDSEMVIKVKEPIDEEYDLIQEGQVLYAYLHLAADPNLTSVLLDKKVVGIAFETITDRFGALPCLMPMSMIAGRLAVQTGAKLLEKPSGGSGILLGGVPGVRRGKVTIIGGGVVGTHALQIAVGLGAEVRILDINTHKLNELDTIYGNRITTLYSNRENLLTCLSDTNLLIGALLIPGAVAPKLVSREDLKNMPSKAVIVDVAVDQGGCCETIKATTHENPTYVVDDILHYGVANMPGAVPLSSSLALNNAIIGGALNIANKGVVAALREDVHLLNGLNTYAGKCVHKGVSEGLGIEYTPVSDFFVR